MTAIHNQGTFRVFATVLGRVLDPSYPLFEDAKADQFVVMQAVFEGDWLALEKWLPLENLAQPAPKIFLNAAQSCPCRRTRSPPPLIGCNGDPCLRPP